ncbi:MAG: malto-oligosyltrehalose synthase [Geminicoccaceae bacterium]|nr:malto-oligosyltrehalose synthase [Geminicoccaceae bacterium]
MTIHPVATYRLQLRNGFGFDEARAILPYLRELGVSHLYLSPVFTARAGSTHGYDAVDPRAIDPVLGGEAGWSALVEALREAGMGLLLDIVPNHLGVGPDNPFWMDLLRRGAEGEGARMFDVDWRALAGGTPGKLLLPVLGRPLDEVLRAGELEVVEEEGEKRIAYYDNRFPLAAGTADGDLSRVLERQHYRLAWWRCGDSLLNWRRFFDITELAGVRVEQEQVFDVVHARVFTMLDKGEVQGLRLDHVDGLADPGGYLVRLDEAWRARSPSEPWVLVEKILGEGEDLPEAWPTAGTTGYEMTNVLLRLLVDERGLDTLDRLYAEMGGDPSNFPDVVGQAKRQILERNLHAEVARLAVRLSAVQGCDFPLGTIRAALIETIVAFPYYRTYGRFNRERLDAAFDAAQRVHPEAVAWLRGHLVPGSPLLTAFEQLTGPAMAKSLEDTAFYRWYRLSALNEVGGEPDHPTASAEETHAWLKERARRWPTALIPTATHDTKRGEDTRMRIAALSHLSEPWARAQRELWRIARPHGTDGTPDGELATFLLQTIAGVWPGVREIDATLADRVTAYAIKALREAKSRTSWTAPDEGFEQAVERCIRGCLDDGEFRTAMAQFDEALAPVAADLSLAQTLLKLTLPGVPDIYQGSESVDLSLVDPDNRRPVDYPRLARFEPSDRKQALVRSVLAWRRRFPRLFTHGDYVPLDVTGAGADGWFAFLRRDGEVASITAVRRRQTEGEAHLVLPQGVRSSNWRALLDDKDSGPTDALASGGSPIALFVAEL